MKLYIFCVFNHEDVGTLMGVRAASLTNAKRDLERDGHDDYELYDSKKITEEGE